MTVTVTIQLYYKFPQEKDLTNSLWSDQQIGT